LAEQQYKDVVDRIMSEISKTNVDAIFGESRQFEDKVVIPIGKISYGWGGGSGRGGTQKQGEQGKEEGEGMGMGMGVKVMPMGFITITADRVTYQPIIDYSLVATVGSMFLGLMLLKTFKVVAIAKRKKYAHYKG